MAGRRFAMSLDRNARRKSPTTWTVLGTPIRRLDIPDLVTARAEYVHTVRVPGMLHGAVVRPPSVGATLVRVDERSVSALPGIVKVVTRRNFVGVVAQKPWQAIQASRTLKVTWTEGTQLPAQQDFFQHLRTQPSRDALVVVSSGSDDPLGDVSWNALYSSAGTLVEDGWTAEMAIPIKSLRYPSVSGGAAHRWGFQIRRNYQLFNMPGVIAWVRLFVLFMLLIERFILVRMERRLFSWRQWEREA